MFNDSYHLWHSVATKWLTEADCANEIFEEVLSDGDSLKVGLHTEDFEVKAVTLLAGLAGAQYVPCRLAGSMMLSCRQSLIVASD